MDSIRVHIYAFIIRKLFRKNGLWGKFHNCASTEKKGQSLEWNNISSQTTVAMNANSGFSENPHTQCTQPGTNVEINPEIPENPEHL